MANNTCLLMRGFDTTGDGTGSFDAAVDGSVTPVVFKMTASAACKCYVHHVHIHIADNGAIKSDTYGAITALTNGVTLKIKNAADEEVVNLFDGIDIKTNADFASIASIEFLNFGSGTVQSISVRYSFMDSFGTPIILEAGEYLEFVVNDNLSTLTQHHIVAQGIEVAA